MTIPECGKLITLEGIEGVGKSSNVEFLTRYLDSRGISSVATREPGGTPLAEEIRQLLLNSSKEGLSEMSGMSELLLMFAARAQNLQEFILPNLKEGRWVICDRFTDSSYAYQGGGRGISMNFISELESMVLGSLKPDLVLVLDVSVETGLKRAGDRGGRDRIGDESKEFFLRVRQVFLERARQCPERYRLVNCEHSLVEVQADIEKEVARLIDDSVKG